MSHPSNRVMVFRLLALGGRVDLGAEIGCGRASVGKEAGEDWVDEGAEDDLGTGGLGQGHPEDEDEFEGVVEG